MKHILIFVLLTIVPIAQCLRPRMNLYTFRMLGQMSDVTELSTKTDNKIITRMKRVISSSLFFLASSCVVYAEAKECVTSSNPQVTTISCRQLGLLDGRLRGCQSIENCLSTSARAAVKYVSPYQFSFGNLDEITVESAFSVLQDAIKLEGLTILKSDEINHYILAAEKNVPKQPTGSSLFYEFLLKNTGCDRLVLYRAVVDKTVLLYPLQQPVSDFGALQNRLNGVFTRTGWLKVGE